MRGATPRKSPSPANTRRLQKEIGSMCPFCPDDDVGHFEVHHIDGDRSNDSMDNLLMLCKKCHSKITKGEIAEEKVRRKKHLLVAQTTPAVPQSRMFSRREIEFFEYAFTKLDVMVQVPVSRIDVDEIAEKTWRLGHWDVKISFLELLMWCYREQPQSFSFFGVLRDLRFEAMTNLGYVATFVTSHWLENMLRPEPLMEQLGFIARRSVKEYSWRYTRSLHQFALWMDANGIAAKIIEAEWKERLVPLEDSTSKE